MTYVEDISNYELRGTFDKIILIYLYVYSYIRSVQVPERFSHSPHKTVVLNSTCWLYNIFKEITRLPTTLSHKMTTIAGGKGNRTLGLFPSQDLPFYSGKNIFSSDFCLDLTGQTFVTQWSLTKRESRKQVFSAGLIDNQIWGSVKKSKEEIMDVG